MPHYGDQWLASCSRRLGCKMDILSPSSHCCQLDQAQQEGSSINLFVGAVLQHAGECACSQSPVYSYQLFCVLLYIYRTGRKFRGVLRCPNWWPTSQSLSDVTLTTKSVVGIRWVKSGTEKCLDWSKLNLSFYIYQICLVGNGHEKKNVVCWNCLRHDHQIADCTDAEKLPQKSESDLSCTLGGLLPQTFWGR